LRRVGPTNPLPVVDSRSGGEVHFSRLATGAWYVSRWFMRVPQVEERAYASVAREGTRTSSQRAYIASFSESGGRVDPVDGPAPHGALATLTAASWTAPEIGAAGARSLAGRNAGHHHHRARRCLPLTRSRGFLYAERRPPGYSRLGLTAVEQELEIGEGTSSITLLQAIGTPQILRQLCGSEHVPDSNVVVRLVLPRSTDRDTVHDTVHDTMPGSALHLSWAKTRVIGPRDVLSQTMAVDLVIDAAGGVTACELPPAKLVRIEERDRDGTVGRQWEVRTPEAGLVVVELLESRRTGR
jgi:hypothetical protein